MNLDGLMEGLARMLSLRAPYQRKAPRPQKDHVRPEVRRAGKAVRPGKTSRQRRRYVARLAAKGRTP